MGFPNVPDVPGVPSIPRGASIQSAATLLVQDGLALLGITSPQWGIYKDGQKVISPDNVISFSYRQDWSIADYPIQKGGFESYDKVNSPFEARIKVSSGGSRANREALLSSVDRICDSMDLYDVITPEYVYTTTNVQHYDYNRTSDRGVGLIVVDIHLLEIRDSATAAFTQTGTKYPSGADPVNGGTVQPKSFIPGSSQLGGAGIPGSW